MSDSLLISWLMNYFFGLWTIILIDSKFITTLYRNWVFKECLDCGISCNVDPNVVILFVGRHIKDTNIKHYSWWRKKTPGWGVWGNNNYLMKKAVWKLRQEWETDGPFKGKENDQIYFGKLQGHLEVKECSRGEFCWLKVSFYRSSNF